MSKLKPYIPTIDRKIVEGCKAGKSKDQRLLFDHFSRRVKAICLRYSANEADAEDIFQESFIAIFEKIKTLKEYNKIDAWIKRVTINKALRFHEKKQSLSFRVSIESYRGNEVNENEIIQSISVQELQEIIQQLPDGYRLVFNLFVVEGYDHKDIAKMLNIKEVTSRSQLFKAKRLLRKMLKAVGIEQYEKKYG